MMKVAFIIRETVMCCKRMMELICQIFRFVCSKHHQWQNGESFFRHTSIMIVSHPLSFQLFVFVGVISFLYCIGSTIFYVFFDQIYSNNDQAPIGVRQHGRRLRSSSYTPTVNRRDCCPTHRRSIRSSTRPNLP